MKIKPLANKAYTVLDFQQLRTELTSNENQKNQMYDLSNFQTLYIVCFSFHWGIYRKQTHYKTYSLRTQILRFMLCVVTF